MVGRPSNGHSRRVRDVIAEQTFEYTAGLLDLDMQSLDEWLEGLVFDIARMPELFPAMFTNNRGELLHAAVYSGEPALVVWFVFDSNSVRLLFITGGQPQNGEG